jgi:hypothetical protein
MDEIDTIKIDVPTFLRLLELAREDVKDDANLHFIAQTVTEISKEKTVTMDDYEKIVSTMKPEDENITELKKLSGIS